MRRIAFAILYSCVLASVAMLAGPAKAGDYYDGGGYHRRHHHHDNVWYSSKCCYKKIVRHERSTRYVRIDEYGDRGGYYERPYRSGHYYGEPRRHYSNYRDYGYPIDRGYRYSSYRDYGYASIDSCYSKRLPIEDGRGGWVWGLKTNCY